MVYVEDSEHRRDPRLAGRVLRYHTWPTVRQQTIGEHSWQVARILAIVWPEAPASVHRYIVQHDMPEMTSGDHPFPIKLNNPVLRDELNKIDDQTMVEICSQWALPLETLESDQKIVFKLCEYIEMWEWALEERMLGNMFAAIVARRCYTAAMDKLTELRTPGWLDVRRRALAYMSRRVDAWAEAWALCQTEETVA